MEPPPLIMPVTHSLFADPADGFRATLPRCPARFIHVGMAVCQPDSVSHPSPAFPLKLYDYCLRHTALNENDYHLHLIHRLRYTARSFANDNHSHSRGK
jgi:hypothetical protein